MTPRSECRSWWHSLPRGCLHQCGIARRKPAWIKPDHQWIPILFERLFAIILSVGLYKFCWGGDCCLPVRTPSYFSLISDLCDLDRASTCLCSSHFWCYWHSVKCERNMEVCIPCFFWAPAKKPSFRPMFRRHVRAKKTITWMVLVSIHYIWQCKYANISSKVVHLEEHSCTELHVQCIKLNFIC